MKITWFGGSTFRMHLGGQIVVVEPGGATEDIDQAELRSGADVSVGFAEDLPLADGPAWRPRLPERLLDAGSSTRTPQVWSVGNGSLLIDADDERPLLVLGERVGQLGRWAAGAVVVVAGSDLAARSKILVEAHAPRLIALAGSETEVDAAFATLRHALDGTGLVALEPGLAVEA